MSFESQRVKQISSSPSMVISMRAKELASQGRDIVDMSLGEPDFDTPAHIIDAACQAMRDGHTRYTAPQGTLALRQAISRKLQRENSLTYSVDEISVGNGAKQVIFNTFMATLEAGDEVIIPAPYLGVLFRYCHAQWRHPTRSALRHRRRLQAQPAGIARPAQ